MTRLKMGEVVKKYVRNKCKKGIFLGENRGTYLIYWENDEIGYLSDERVHKVSELERKVCKNEHERMRKRAMKEVTENICFEHEIEDKDTLITSIGEALSV